MKRLAVLLVAIAAVVAAAAFAVPSNAATVNGAGVSQDTLNADLAAISGSTAYQCYLYANNYVAGGGQATYVPVTGRGQGTYNATFVAEWLSKLINGQFISQLAAERHVTVGAADVSAATGDLTNSITSTIAQAAQSGVSCAGSGTSILAAMPASFVARQVQMQATANAVLASEPGAGISTADIARYFAAHKASLATTCITLVETSSEAAAAAIRTQVLAGTPIAQAAGSNGSVSSGCATPAQASILQSVADVPVGGISEPLPYQSSGSYVLIQISSRTPGTIRGSASIIRRLLLQSGEARAAAALALAARHADVSVNPRYGTWTPKGSASITPPSSPPLTALLSGTADKPQTAAAG
jgi:hypothetical protein